MSIKPHPLQLINNYNYYSLNAKSLFSTLFLNSLIHPCTEFGNCGPMMKYLG